MITALSLLVSMIPLSAPFGQSNGAIPVKVVKQGSQWQLLRAGKPFEIKGVGGTGRMDLLFENGGNAMRTWGTDRAGFELDAVHQRGGALMLGIWLGHKSYFDYANKEQTAKQAAMVRGEVQKFKDHPGLLMWGLGNEMEINNDTPELWSHIEELCKIVKSIDPNHPTVTVVADITDQKIANINKYCPSLDILGINSYGGLISLPDRLKKAGWTRPYVITEFGPTGPWENPKSEWNAALEPNSSVKAAKYAADYDKSIAGQKGWCLGSFAFLWGDKQEETPTWFGMFLPTGEKTEAVDVIRQRWTGKPSANLSPRILSEKCSVSRKDAVAGGSADIEVQASDPEGDALQYWYEMRWETGYKTYAGENEQKPDVVPGYDWKQLGPKTTMKLPSRPGAYRIYLKVTDGKGSAATVNWPFRIR